MKKEEKLELKFEPFTNLHIGLTVWGPLLSFIILLIVLDAIGIERFVGEHIGTFAKLIVDGYRNTN